MNRAKIKYTENKLTLTPDRHIQTWESEAYQPKHCDAQCDSAMAKDDQCE